MVVGPCSGVVAAKVGVAVAEVAAVVVVAVRASLLSETALGRAEAEARTVVRTAGTTFSGARGGLSGLTASATRLPAHSLHIDRRVRLNVLFPLLRVYAMEHCRDVIVLWVLVLLLQLLMMMMIMMMLIICMPGFAGTVGVLASLNIGCNFGEINMRAYDVRGATF
jgi:hypothetical protein